MPNNKNLNNYTLWSEFSKKLLMDITNRVINDHNNEETINLGTITEQFNAVITKIKENDPESKEVTRTQGAIKRKFAEMKNTYNNNKELLDRLQRISHPDKNGQLNVQDSSNKPVHEHERDHDDSALLSDFRESAREKDPITKKIKLSDNTALDVKQTSVSDSASAFTSNPSSPDPAIEQEFYLKSKWSPYSMELLKKLITKYTRIYYIGESKNKTIKTNFEKICSEFNATIRALQKKEPQTKEMIRTISSLRSKYYHSSIINHVNNLMRSARSKRQVDLSGNTDNPAQQEIVTKKHMIDETPSMFKKESYPPSSQNSQKKSENLYNDLMAEQDPSKSQIDSLQKPTLFDTTIKTPLNSTQLSQNKTPELLSSNSKKQPDIFKTLGAWLSSESIPDKKSIGTLTINDLMRKLDTELGKKLKELQEQVNKTFQPPIIQTITSDCILILKQSLDVIHVEVKDGSIHLVLKKFQGIIIEHNASVDQALTQVLARGSYLLTIIAKELESQKKMMLIHQKTVKVIEGREIKLLQEIYELKNIRKKELANCLDNKIVALETLSSDLCNINLNLENTPLWPSFMFNEDIPKPWGIAEEFMATDLDLNQKVKAQDEMISAIQARLTRADQMEHELCNTIIKARQLLHQQRAKLDNFDHVATFENLLSRDSQALIPIKGQGQDKSKDSIEISKEPEKNSRALSIHSNLNDSDDGEDNEHLSQIFTLISSPTKSQEANDNHESSSPKDMPRQITKTRGLSQQNMATFFQTAPKSKDNNQLDLLDEQSKKP